jgi:hypothetical protein
MRLKELLADCIDECHAIIRAGARQLQSNADAILRWAVMYLVIDADLGETALQLCDGTTNNRALIILRRAIFEHAIRFRYFIRNPQVAEDRLHDFNALVKGFDEGLVAIRDAMGIEREDLVV